MDALILMIVPAFIVFAVALNKQFSSNDSPIEISNVQSLEQKLKILAAIDIQLKPEFGIDSLLDSWGREPLEEPGFELLLSALGGTEEQEPWRYLSGDVWHFDTEAIESHGDYARIAERIMELAGGSLPLENLRDYVDLTEEEVWISFKFQGEGQRINFEVNDDWVDGQVFYQLAALLRASGANKELVYHDLGGQDMIIACLSEDALERLNARGLQFMPL